MTIELEVTDIANGGQAIGRHDGKTIFVPYTIPGETITATIINDRGSYAFAEGVTVLDPSADRVLPRCSHFGLAHGGCSTWQHIDYAAQLALKTDIVLDQLERIGRFTDAPIQLCLPSQDQWHYRHEVTLTKDKQGKLAYQALDGKSTYPIEDCHLLTPALLAVLPSLDIELDTLEKVIVRDNGQGNLMLIISTSDDEAPELEVDFPASVNFLLSDNEPANLIGNTHLNYTILGETYRVTAGSAMRPNPRQTELLLQVIREWLNLSGKESVLDLYAGVGLTSAFIAEDANLITSVDHYPPAMTDAEENLSQFDHVNVIEGDVVDILHSLPDDEDYQIAIVDPPHQGLSKDTIDAIETTNLKRIIYVADDPAILARDAKRLHERLGFSLDAVQPIDFEPQTHKVVSVAHFGK